jgi:hypothetical protein
LPAFALRNGRLEFFGEKQRGGFWLALVMQGKPENETPITLYDEDSTN